MTFKIDSDIIIDEKRTFITLKCNTCNLWWSLPNTQSNLDKVTHYGFICPACNKKRFAKEK